MKKQFLFVICFCGSSAIAVPIDEIDPDDVYYLSQIGGNEPVVVVRVDKDLSRVKIRMKDGFTDWVSPSKLIKKSDNLGDEIEEGAWWALGGLALLCAFDEDCRNNKSRASSSRPDYTYKPTTTDASSELYYVSCLVNSTRININYQYRWDKEDDWIEKKLEPGWSDWRGQKADQKFHIKFDNSFEEGYQRKDYWLKRKYTSKGCDGGMKYEFYIAKDGNIDVRMSN